MRPKRSRGAVSRRRRRCSHQVHEACPVTAAEGLPRFARPLGLDFIITPANEVVLIELQHGFGRLGLLQLFPKANRTFRKRFRTLLREQGTCFHVTAGIREICRDKIVTYRHFSDLQPASVAYRRWTPRIARWLEGLEADLVLSKPPTESCGRGIQIFDRRAFLDAAGAISLPSPTLLQAFTECRPIVGDDGLERVGCIRHIVVMVSDGEAIRFVHLPSYWRVAPEPRDHARELPGRDALTANISRGATPVPVSERDEAALRSKTETICAKLLSLVLERPIAVRHEAWVIAADGELRGG